MNLLMRIVTLIAGTALLLAPMLVRSINAGILCEGMVIDLADSSKHRFVTADDISRVIASTGVKITGARLSEIPLDRIEQSLSSFTELRKAEAYVGGDRMIHILISQREPVMRVIPSYGGDFFIDTEGVIMRRHNLYTPNLHILEADMVFNAGAMTGRSIFESEATANLARAFDLVNYIRGHSIWNSMISQLSMTRDGRVTLVPHAGNHTVMLGSTDNYEEKLHNLLVFYRQAMPVAGWDRYRVVNVEYKGQVVCQRR